MSERLCGAPRSTSLTLGSRGSQCKLAGSCDFLTVDTEALSLPVMTQRLHVNVNSGRIGSGSALGGERENG